MSGNDEAEEEGDKGEGDEDEEEEEDEDERLSRSISSRKEEVGIILADCAHWGGVWLWWRALVKLALMPGRLSGCPSRYLFARVVGLNWISALKRHTPGRSVIAFTSWQLITACSRANKRTRKNK